jgi:hypothetical protein
MMYNWTEAAFKPVSIIFILLLLGIMNVKEMHNDK